MTFEKTVSSNDCVTFTKIMPPIGSYFWVKFLPNYYLKPSASGHFSCLVFPQTGWWGGTELTHPWFYLSSPHCQCPFGSCTWHDGVAQHCREWFQWTRHQPRTSARPATPWTCWWAGLLLLPVRVCSSWHTDKRTAFVRTLEARKTLSAQGRLCPKRDVLTAWHFYPHPLILSKVIFQYSIENGSFCFLTAIRRNARSI